MMRTFGDSTRSPGQHVTDRYIVAQLPENANLDWARDLRTALGNDELKYKKYLELRHYIQANAALWKRVLDGTAEATIVVIENDFYIEALIYKLRSEGAEIGHDVSFDELLKQAALAMIRHAPIMRLNDLEPDRLIAVPPKQPIYTPEFVFKQIGGKFSDATVFAARAHAAFDIDDLGKAVSTNELFLGPYKSRALSQLKEIDRVFDKEHPPKRSYAKPDVPNPRCPFE